MPIYFGLDQGRAREIAGEAAAATAQWREEASRFGPTRAECDRMESAFVHADLEPERKRYSI